MSQKINTMTVNAYARMYCLLAQMKKLERGDSDSAGSTLRTMGIVILVVTVVLVIGAAVLLAGDYISTQVGNGRTSFGALFGTR